MELQDQIDDRDKIEPEREEMIGEGDDEFDEVEELDEDAEDEVEE